jgi:tRNA (cytosine40_48-C5)-methyltransferase
MNIFKKRYAEIGGSLTRPNYYKCIRVNTKKISSKELAARLRAKFVEIEKVPFLKDAYYVKKSRFNLVSTPEYLMGYFYIQDAGTQIAVDCLKPRGVVLDGFASPGGKTLQLAEYCKVVAIEQKPLRFEKLINNIERWGADNILAYQMDFRSVTKKFPYILMDVPCSGNFMLDDRWAKKNTLERVNERSNLQKELLSHGISLLEENGVLLYTTCSLEPEENEEVIQYALDNFQVKLEKINCIGEPGVTNAYGKKFHKSMKHCRRLWPEKTGTVGFFMARLKKC